jgi:hypothetical protein
MRTLKSVQNPDDIKRLPPGQLPDVIKLAVQTPTAALAMQVPLLTPQQAREKVEPLEPNAPKPAYKPSKRDLAYIAAVHQLAADGLPVTDRKLGEVMKVDYSRPAQMRKKPGFLDWLREQLATEADARWPLVVKTAYRLAEKGSIDHMNFLAKDSRRVQGWQRSRAVETGSTSTCMSRQHFATTGHFISATATRTRMTSARRTRNKPSRTRVSPTGSSTAGPSVVEKRRGWPLKRLSIASNTPARARPLPTHQRGARGVDRPRAARPHPGRAWRTSTANKIATSSSTARSCGCATANTKKTSSAIRAISSASSASTRRATSPSSCSGTSSRGCARRGAGSRRSCAWRRIPAGLATGGSSACSCVLAPKKSGCRPAPGRSSRGGRCRRSVGRSRLEDVPTRCFVPAFFQDNKILQEVNPLYLASIYQIGGDYARQLAEGDWDANESMVVGGDWRDKHVVGPSTTRPCSSVRAHRRHVIPWHVYPDARGSRRAAH